MLSMPGLPGCFVKAQDLFDQMYASLADRSSRRLVNRLLRIDVLLIDELGYLNLRPEQSNIFSKLMEERSAIQICGWGTLHERKWVNSPQR
jgi:DNA replication protein DnaC